MLAVGEMRVGTCFYADIGSVLSNGSCPLIVQSPAPRLRPATVAEMRPNPSHKPAPAIVQQWKSVRRHTPSIMSLQYEVALGVENK
jgi:hypothetical protein